MASIARKMVGELLCEKDYLDEASLHIALDSQQQEHKPIGRILLDLDYITAAQLNEVLSGQSGIEKINLAGLTIPPEVISLVPAELVSKYNIIPVSRNNGRLAVAMTDPFNPQIVEDLRLVANCAIKRFYAEPAQMEKAILKYYGSNVARMLDNLAPQDRKPDEQQTNGDYSEAKLSELAREPSLVNLVNLIILEAIEARASDIHIEPFETEVKIKYRVDGLLVEKAPSSKRLQAAITSRIKIMASMNIAERFVPQDGHIDFHGKNSKIDIRVSTVPTIYGESVTMRLLDRSASLMNLTDLGMSDECLKGFSQALQRAHGIVLVTGPTGCGKTTTLYGALNKIYTPTLKIITIEDPVEYQLDGVIQMPVNPKRGLTFATGLRHILRQDPDIVMVGEIRDRETADIAIRAALTGHLVFSTLHTNDAVGAITRLLDMGVEPFLLASCLEAVLAQRLVRRICSKCKQSYQPDEALLRSFNGGIRLKANMKFYHGAGCNDCLQTGMKGRMGIFELLRINDTLRQLIAERPSADQIMKAAPADHISMRKDGIAKILAGLTNPEEVLRVTQADNEET